MEQSPQVLEWQAQGEKRGELRSHRTLLRTLLEDRFGPLPQELQVRITAVEDSERLRGAVRQVLKIQALDDLQL